MQSGLRASAPLVLLGWLALINFVLLVFNLLPAFPLDGGRIARALVWRITGDPNRATLACARLGQAFGVVVIVGGVALVLESYTTSGLWFVLIGLFLTQSARQALAQATVGALIRDVTVADIMDRRPVTIPSATSLLDAEYEYFRDGATPWLVVADDDGRYRGLLLKERLDHELREGRPALTAAEVSDDSPPWRIDASATLETALRSDGLRAARRDRRGRRGRPAGGRADSAEHPPGDESVGGPIESGLRDDRPKALRQNMPEHDVLIIGAGLAGQRAALAAAREGRVGRRS